MKNEKSSREFLCKIQGKLNQNITSNSNDRRNVLNLKILIGLDVSGSITLEEFKKFMQQIDKIKGLSVVKVIEVDNEIVAMYDYFKNYIQKVVRLRGGGGTDFTEFFKIAEKIKPDAILFMTDGYVCNEENVKCDIPVGWILTPGGRKPYTFGEHLFTLK